jgi:hypothetical protein
MKRLLLVIVMMVGLAASADAQITVPHTLADGETIDAARLNTNFSTVFGDALNRTGGTMTGTLTSRDVIPSANDTYDLASNGTRFQDAFFSGTVTAGTSTYSTNVSIGGTLGVTGATTFTGAATANGVVDVNSTFTIGSGNVQPFDSTGKIQAISSTYFASLDGTNLTGVAKLASTNTYTAQNDFLDYTETFTSPTISGGALTLNLNNGSHFTVALNANTSITVSNVPASKAVSFTLMFTADGTPRTVTWPTGTVWAQGAAPTMTSTNGKRDFFTFITYDGGTTWFGFVGGQNF